MLTTLPPSCAVVMKSGNLNFLETSGPLQACNGTALLYFYFYLFARLWFTTQVRDLLSPILAEYRALQNAIAQALIFTKRNTTLLTLHHYNFYYILCQTTTIILSSQFLISSQKIFLFYHFIPPRTSKTNCGSLTLFSHLHTILVPNLYF